MKSKFYFFKHYKEFHYFDSATRPLKPIWLIKHLEEKIIKGGTEPE